MLTRFISCLLGIWVMLGLSLYALNPIYAQALTHYYKGEYVQSLSKVARVSEQDVPEKPYLKSMIFLKQGRYKEAKSTLLGANSLPDFEDYRKYILLSIAGASKDRELVNNLVASQWSYDNVYLLHRAHLDYAQFLAQNGDWVGAQSWANRVLNTEKGTDLAAKAYRILVMKALTERNQNEAISNYLNMVLTSSQEDPQLVLWGKIQHLFSFEAGVMDYFLNSKDLVIYLKKLKEARLFAQLERQTQLYLMHTKRYTDIAEVCAYRGDALCALGQPRKGFSMYQKAIVYSRGTSLQSKYYYLAAQAAMALKDGKFPSYLERLAFGFPKNPYEPWAMYWLCRYYREEDKLQDQARVFSAFEKKCAKSEAFRQWVWDEKYGRLRSALAGSVERQPLRPLFDDVVGNAQVSRRLISHFSKTGDWATAMIQYPLSFQTLSWLKDTWEEEDGDQLKPLTTKAERLYRAGLGVLVSEELAYRSVRQPTTTQGLELTYLYGTVVAKLRTLIDPDFPILSDLSFDPGRYLRAGMPKFVLKLFYPKLYWESITKYATKYNVDPYLVLAVIREESTFDDKALSRTNARGLMQVMPRTGQDVSFRLGMRWHGEDSLYDTDLNIQLGTYYLAWLKKQFKGPDFYTISAYNAGPDQASGWIRGYKGKDLESYISHIPYGETKRYVRRVLNSYLIYKLLYGEN